MSLKNKFAQTNIQLYSQMHELGYSLADLQLAHSSYSFVIELMTGQYRASFKPFTAHLVGTASILAWLGAPVELISAGMLHAIYESGDFGDSLPAGLHPTRRAAVRDILGSEIESAIANYYAYSWDVNAIRSSIQRAHDFEQWETGIITIRLANELEDLLDYGLAYSGEGRRRQALYRDSHFDLVVQLADTIGYPELARELESAFTAANTIEFPLQLRGSNPPQQSFSTIPRSYKKLKHAIAQRLRSS